MGFLINIFQILLWFPFSNNPGNLNDEWKLSASKNGIDIYYRPVLIGDTFATREMRISLNLKCDFEEFITVLRNEDQLKKWVYGLKSSNLHEEKSDQWTVLQHYDFPWPFRDKQALTRYQLYKSEKQWNIRIKSLPCPSQKPLPLDPMIGKWVLTKMADHSIHIDYQMTALVPPSMPRWIQDPVIKKVMFRSFQKIQTMMEE